MDLIPDINNKEIQDEMSNMIDLQENFLFKNVSVDEEDSLIKDLIAKGYCSYSNFPHLLNISLIYRPKNVHFVQTLIIYLNNNLQDSFQNLKKYIFAPSSLIDPKQIHILIGLIHLLRICYDSNLIDFSEILSFIHNLRDQKRSYRIHVILLYLWFMREIEMNDHDFSSDLFYFSFKHSKSFIISDAVNYYLDNRKMIQNDNWKVFNELITIGYDKSTLLGCIAVDDYETLQQIISQQANYRWNQRMEMSLFDPISTQYDELNILNFSAIKNSMSCFKFLYLNCPKEQKKFVYPESFDAAIIGGNSEIVHLIEQVPEAFQESVAFHRPHRHIAYAALFHHNDLVDWLINTKQNKIDNDAIQYAAKSGNALFFTRYFDSINAFQYEDVTPLLTFRQLSIFKFVIKSGKYDINASGTYGWTALHFAAANGYEEELKFLCEQDGIDFNAKNKDGKTAVDCARTTEKMNAIKIIEEAIEKRKK